MVRCIGVDIPVFDSMTLNLPAESRPPSILGTTVTSTFNGLAPSDASFSPTPRAIVSVTSAASVPVDLEPRHVPCGPDRLGEVGGVRLTG
jgi:hypothetical protein